jgi:membrane associated rhomboid family serine protease
MFAWAEWRGGSEDIGVLFALGALWAPAITRDGEWWRLATASVLHLGPVHLVANMFMLAVLGRAIESRYGAARMLVLSLWCGIGSMALVYFAMRYGLIEDGLLVGASGAILGLLGALTMEVLMTWLRTRDTLDRFRLAMLGLILTLQAAVDFSIPNVSFAAHASGFVLGFLAGIGLAVRTERIAA